MKNIKLLYTMTQACILINEYALKQGIDILAYPVYDSVCLYMNDDVGEEHRSHIASIIETVFIELPHEKEYN